MVGIKRYCSKRTNDTRSNKTILTIELGEDKREKLLSFSKKGQQLYGAINTRICDVQDKIIENTGLSDDELNYAIQVIQKIHEQIVNMEE